MAVRIIGAAAIAACNSIVALVDAAESPGTLVIYQGSRPANVGTAIGAQTPLVTFTLNEVAFGNAVELASGATATANAVDNVQAQASGTAQFFRVFNGDGGAIFDGTVTDTSGNGDLKLSSVAVIEGIDVTVVSLTATMPKGA